MFPLLKAELNKVGGQANIYKYIVTVHVKQNIISETEQNWM